jgi:hypothetical protein
MNHTRLTSAAMVLAVAGCSAVWAQEASKKFQGVIRVPVKDGQQLVQETNPEARPAPRPQASPRATVMQRIGADTDVTITFNRPGVKGRKIWGDLVPYGLAPANQYAKNPYPWRGGANQTTTIEFSTPVKIGDKTLPAGKYGMHFIPSEKDWVVIFNKVTSGHGSYAYDQAEDAQRLTVTPVESPFTEWLEYGFENLSATGADGYLRWEKLKIPFAISID